MADESKEEMIPVQPRIVRDELICNELTIWHNDNPPMRLYAAHENVCDLMSSRVLVGCVERSETHLARAGKS